MTDAETRAELERIEECLGFDPECLCAEDHKQTLRLLAQKHRALREIREIIEAVDNRCMAADGPVNQTLREMTPWEIKKIYQLAKTACKGGE